jgi:hypothetical protein
MKNQIISVIAKTRLRYDRGYAFFSEFVKIFEIGTLMVLLIDKVNEKTGLGISYYFLVAGIIIIPTLFYLFGLFDEKKFGFWKYENQYNSNELNPFLKELNDKVDRLLRK